MSFNLFKFYIYIYIYNYIYNFSKIIYIYNIYIYNFTKIIKIVATLSHSNGQEPLYFNRHRHSKQKFVFPYLGIAEDLAGLDKRGGLLHALVLPVLRLLEPGGEGLDSGLELGPVLYVLAELGTFSLHLKFFFKNKVQNTPTAL